MKDLAVIGCMLLSSCVACAQQKDTFEIYFPSNVSRLSKDAEFYIDNLIFKDTLIHGDKLMVLGYTDYVGDNLHNDALSMQRARSVKQYLVTAGFTEQDIALCVGKGKVDRSVENNSGYGPDRKVQIVIVHTPPVPTAPVPVVSSVKAKDKIDITQLKVNESIALNNLYFEPGTDILLPRSDEDLMYLLKFLRENPKVTIRIEGHICCLYAPGVHDAIYKGRNLSELRAMAVSLFLAANGIDRNRMKLVGFGNSYPVVEDEETEEDRQRNRRVEIRILSK